MTDSAQLIKQELSSQYTEELAVLKKNDAHWKPDQWQLSPQAVRTFIIGHTEIDGVTIQPKYFGHHRLVETAIATLATQRALLLTGYPGTAKSWLAEHLVVAISGTSRHLIQGSSATSEEDLLFGWNYASLIAKGPQLEALVPSALYNAMEAGQLCRIEELSRIPAMIQDNLLSLLSEKLMVVPDLDMEIRAKKGFNLIATANDKDKGTYPMSDALKRRFNVIQMPFPDSLAEEVKIVEYKVAQSANLLPKNINLPIKEIERVVQIFRELRSGQTEDDHQKINRTQNHLSTAEAIATIEQCIYLAAFFGKGEVSATEVAATLPGAIVKDPDKDEKPWEEYKKVILPKRTEWEDLQALLS